MSLQFHDPTNLKGLVQIYEDETGRNDGDISGNSTLLKKFTAEVNLALDDYLAIALTASGRWKLDDSNHTKHPIIYTDINSGQSDYEIVTTDQQGNLILDIYKIAILPSATATEYNVIYPFDAEQIGQDSDLVSERSASGTPVRYDKLGTHLFFENTFNYSATNGIKAYVNREASYFTSSDTTKKPGVPGLHHRYFAIKPALAYARRNNLSNYPALLKEVQDFEGDERMRLEGSIKRYFAKRNKDEKPKMTMKKINYI